MKNQTIYPSIYDTTIRLLILMLIVAWCLLIMAPFASIILWSLILAIAMYPLHKTLAQKMGARPNWLVDHCPLFSHYLSLFRLVC
ncbi:MAG: hypothetical protein U5K79_15390 [Cyclobacteriaceae bacterium]|nr:hypothetical protein [Cyclobacteriaceae bacterium]